ncbi:MAG TPA: hypothetical protein V6D22_03455 [Candidatus Obscuribacterales bacterium]
MYETWDGKPIHSDSSSNDSFLSQALHYAFGPRNESELDWGRMSAHATVFGLGVAGVKAAIWGGETSGNLLTGAAVGVGAILADVGIYGYHKLFDA